MVCTHIQRKVKIKKENKILRSKVSFSCHMLEARAKSWERAVSNIAGKDKVRFLKTNPPFCISAPVLWLENACFFTGYLHFSLWSILPDTSFLLPSSEHFCMVCTSARTTQHCTAMRLRAKTIRLVWRSKSEVSRAWKMPRIRKTLTSFSFISIPGET